MKNRIFISLSLALAAAGGYAARRPLTIAVPVAVPRGVAPGPALDDAIATIRRQGIHAAHMRRALEHAGIPVPE